MKRVNGFFLSLALISTIMFGIIHLVSADEQKKNDSTIQSCRTVYGSTNIIDAQYISKQNQTKALDDILTADYSYVMNKKESDIATVNMNITFFTHSRKYYAMISGAVDLYELPSGFSFWEGPLDGVLLLNEKRIRIIVSFLQKDGSEDVCLSFTFCVNEEERGAYPLLFSVGKGFITEEINKEILSLRDGITTDEDGELDSKDTGGFLNNKGTTLLFSSTKSTLAGVVMQTTNCYFEYGTNRLLIGLRSNTNYATQYFLSMASSPIATYVYRMKYNLVRTSGSSHISGIEKFNLPTGGNYYSNTLVSLLFADALNILGIPTNSFLAILNNLKGSITLSHATNNSYAQVDFGLLQYANFDSISTGVPAVFQLIRSTSYSQPPYNYSVSTELRYRSNFRELNTGYYLYHYLDANSLSTPISVPIQ